MNIWVHSFDVVTSLFLSKVVRPPLAYWCEELQIHFRLTDSLVQAINNFQESFIEMRILHFLNEFIIERSISKQKKNHLFVFIGEIKWSKSISKEVYFVMEISSVWTSFAKKIFRFDWRRWLFNRQWYYTDQLCAMISILDLEFRFAT